MQGPPGVNSCTPYSLQKTYLSGFAIEHTSTNVFFSREKNQSFKWPTSIGWADNKKNNGG